MLPPLLLLLFLLTPPLQAKPDIDEADNRVAAAFGRADACLADRQYDEAVEILRGIMEESSGRLWPLTPWRYITVRDYCQMRLAALPPDALALYRGRVDPLAETWYKEGVDRRDRDKLLLVARRAFASRWGDDALLALGEMALEEADYAAARGYWEKILPLAKKQNAADKAVDGPADNAADNAADKPAAAWLSYPDTDIDPAAVRARLVLTSILEGSPRRAKDELIQFTRLHADARGRLGGLETNFAQALAHLLAESRQWPPLSTSPDWPTFAGRQWRNKIARSEVDPAAPAWRVRLRAPLAKVAKQRKSSDDENFGLVQQQIAQLEMGKLPADVMAKAKAQREFEALLKAQGKDASMLNFHPAVVGNLVFVATGQEILGLDLRTGKPAWGQAGEGGAIFRDELADSRATGTSRIARAARRAAGVRVPMASDLIPRPSTITVQGGQLFACMRSSAGGGYMICLDIEAEGRLLWQTKPENQDWEFEGSPVCDGPNVYVAMRMIGIRPQAYVACFDAQTGRRRWRRYICGADAAASSMDLRPTRQLLTLKGRRIYYNTNLGAVAAISTVDGQLEWVSLYPQKKRPASRNLGAIIRAYTPRSLNPCLYHRGLLYVAPADSPRIFALDAVTGRIVWQTGSQVENVTHLLGVAGDSLIVSGKRLYWIETGTANPAAGGKLKHVWPRAERAPGFGRGILAGEHVYWPTREKIYIFHQRTARLVRSIDLGPKKASGGNLTIAHGRLLIATPQELITFDNTAGKAPKEKDY